MLKTAKNIYNRVSNFLSIKNVTWITVVFFILLLVPMFYLSFINRASGDDYGYAALTRMAWISEHSLSAVMKAAFETIQNYYKSWQGTWFSIFLFSLQPEIFSVKAYSIVVFLMLFLWIGSTFLLFRKLLKDYLKFDNQSTNLVILLFLIICISFIPSKKSSIFWYNGCAHYMIPFAMCQMVVYWLLKYGENYEKRYFIGLIIFMTLLGGANYQATLFSLIVAVYFMIADYWMKRDRRCFWVVLSVMLECAGLIISMKSPGNAVRGGEEFGFSVGLIIKTVGMSFVDGIKDIFKYLQDCPIIFAGLLFIFFVMLEAVKRREKSVHIKYAGLLLLSVFCLYSAMQAPAIYAGVEVSGGVYNTNFQVFMIMAVMCLEAAAEKIGTWIRKNKSNVWEELHVKVILPGWIICAILLLVCRSDMKESTAWICMDYIATGQASDYKEQMHQLTELMLDEKTDDVVVPFINDVQGPLMHMPVTEDPNAWSNTVICKYYNKKSVVAIPRDEWNDKYQ